LLRLLAIATVLLGMWVATSAAADSTNMSLKHSRDVLRFFDNHRWLTAPNKEKCWHVPWQKSCRIARQLVKEHRERVDRLSIPVGEAQIRAYIYRTYGRSEGSCMATIIDWENVVWEPTVDYGFGRGNVYEAYGLPQANPGTKMSSAGADWRTNPVTQLKWMYNYSVQRYGSLCAAFAHRRDRGTY
jgi:hypothetical protein